MAFLTREHGMTIGYICIGQQPVFVMRIIWNTRICCVGKLRSFLRVQQVVCTT